MQVLPMPTLLEKLPSSLTNLEKQKASQLAEALIYRWTLKARPNQLPPLGDWRTWLVLAGRGFGKTRVGAEWVRSQVESGRCSRLALVGPTSADARDVMVEGESGIKAVCPPWNRPRYEPSKRRLTWPNGAIATMYSADEPERLRGPQHDGAWADEIGSWRYPSAWDMLMFGLRLGSNPRAVATTTPKPIGLVKELMKAPTTHLTRGTTYDNSENLARGFLEGIISKYEGTRLGRQELNAELLEDTPGALWTMITLEACRVTQVPQMERIVVGVDPSISNNDGSNETGIVAVGKGENGQFYTLEDASMNGSPSEWATAAIATYHKVKADRIVVEVNQGGDMVEHTIRSVAGGENIPITKVHATRGKYLRAEPIAAIYEQGRFHHLGFFPDLESQMSSWVPGDTSPDRLDALVWAATDLTRGGQVEFIGEEMSNFILSLDGNGWGRS